MIWEYETLETSQLKPASYNPREISKDEFEGLKQSLKTFGFADPAVVNSNNNVIVGGHQRIKAWEALGNNEVPCMLAPLTDKQEKKLNVLLNSQAISGRYDDLMLSELLEGMKLDDDYESLRLDQLEPLDLSDTEVEEDEAPEVSSEPPVSQLGSIYQLGRHRVMCGDSTDAGSVAILMDGNKADMVFTDPPYGVDYSGGIQFTKDGVKKNQRERLKDDQYGTDIYTEVIPIIASITNGAVYTWFAGSKGKSVYEAIEAVGDIHALIIWKKNGGYSSMNANYKENKEPCLYWKPKNGKLNFIGKTTETTVWDLDKEGKNEYHPTQKPIALCAKAINNHSGKLVADLFLGSGSTLIACEQTDRTCYGMELDPKYTDVIRKRWVKFVHGAEALENDKWIELTPEIE